MLQLVLTPGPPGVLRQPRWRPPVQWLSEAGLLIGAALGSVAGVVVDPALPPGCRARICVGDTAELLRRCAASKGAERERTRTQRGRHQEHLRHSPNSSDAQFLWGWGSGSGGGAVQSGMLLPTPWHPRASKGREDDCDVSVAPDPRSLLWLAVATFNARGGAGAGHFSTFVNRRSERKAPGSSHDREKKARRGSRLKVTTKGGWRNALKR